MELAVWLSLVLACVVVGMTYGRFTPGSCCNCGPVVGPYCGTYCDGDAPRYYAVTFGSVTARSGITCAPCADVFSDATIIVDSEETAGGGVQACRWQTDSLNLGNDCYAPNATVMRLQMFLFCDTTVSPSEIAFEARVIGTSLGVGRTMARWLWQSGTECTSEINCVTAPVGVTMDKTSTDTNFGACNWPATITLDGPV